MRFQNNGTRSFDPAHTFKNARLPRARFARALGNLGALGFAYNGGPEPYSAPPSPPPPAVAPAPAPAPAPVDTTVVAPAPAPVDTSISPAITAVAAALPATAPGMAP